ncbi:MAG: PD-(D/E)XK nuclease family protein [Candidatus Liptonbacteria bacterium]|nr:PD-(D/E)XK nuclease family protein [Candidatus Liptonbacteria bacterium]
MTKLSRSKIDLFVDCQRCFWLDLKKGIKRPPPFPYTINNAIDYLLKQEFDAFREKGMPHPIMVENSIDAVPYQNEKLKEWRHNFTGVRHDHEPTDFTIFGAVDDVWVNPDGELIVVDYKATGANEHKVHDSYRRQMEIYQWLLRRNGFEVSPVGYFVFAKANKGNGFSAENGPTKATLPFDLFIESHKGDDSWIEEILLRARETADSDESPVAGENCQYCRYSTSVGNCMPSVSDF